MYEKIETKNDNVVENDKYVNLIGILLIMPIWMILGILLRVINFNNGDYSILGLFSMYLPIIIGLTLSYRLYKSKMNISISKTILVIIVLAICFYYIGYFVDFDDPWDGVGFVFLWLISTAICKVLSCVFYAKIAGREKAINFFLVYILIIVSSFFLGFWR